MWSLSIRHKIATHLLNCNKKCPYRLQTAYFTDSFAVSINSTFPPSANLLLLDSGHHRRDDSPLLWGWQFSPVQINKSSLLQWELQLTDRSPLSCQHAVGAVSGRTDAFSSSWSSGKYTGEWSIHSWSSVLSCSVINHSTIHHRIKHRVWDFLFLCGRTDDLSQMPEMVMLRWLDLVVLLYLQ